MSTTTELTEQYISRHMSIKHCLKKGIINYSALARQIALDLKLDNKTSMEAILIAARRYKDKIAVEDYEKKINELYSDSNMDIKNNIIVYTLGKNIYPDALIDIERRIKKKNALFYAIEGTRTITIIIQKQSRVEIEKFFKSNMLSKKTDLSLITINSPGIWSVPGAVNYITGLFMENDLNIQEFMSCYDDTLIVIKSRDIPTAMQFLNY